MHVHMFVKKCKNSCLVLHLSKKIFHNLTNSAATMISDNKKMKIWSEKITGKYKSRKKIYIQHIQHLWLITNEGTFADDWLTYPMNHRKGVDGYKRRRRRIRESIYTSNAS